MRVDASRDAACKLQPLGFFFNFDLDFSLEFAIERGEIVC